ncbi:hypothetical protein JZ751_007411 [Albula glossodonta]|uniref:C2H2-type domain-containing protein n=1 Tax=Albula glossodonta TaxID=121402 RepID=A0A8T2N5B0_9TELE|nr:hypothetical protein JZ751_007411 [Albula glossodonta]
MAAVYTAKGGRSEPDAGTFPPKNTQAGVKRGVAPLLTNAKMIKVEESSEDENTSLAEQIPTRVRSETATMDAIPAIAIKEESIEDDEYVQIKLVDVEESSEERTENNESDRDNESIDGEWLFRCVDCGEAFGQREAYLEHQRQHVHDGPIVCLDSDSQWNDLLVSEDGGRRTLCCAICGRKFSSSRGFFTHQLKHRNEALKQEPGAEVTAPKQRLFKCEDCGKAYSSIGLCLNHQRSHKQASKSVFHQLDHLKKKSFQCPTCGRCYSRASALDAHRRCHEVKLIKVRNSCMEKSVSTQEHVVENGDVTIKEEKKGKPLYECTECGRAFSTTTGLSTHQRFTSHPKCSEAKPKEETKKLFNCNECDKSFLTNTALAIHQRWHIRRARISSSGQSFSCEECGKVFTSLTFYHKHQRLVHSGETPAKSFLHQVCQLKKKAFECKDCGRRFSRATALQSHQLCHTDVFGDAIEKASPKPATTSASSSPPQKLYLCDKVKPESFAIGALVYTQETPQASPVSGDLSCDEADDDMGLDGSEINDFIVEVVSISGSDEEKEENDPEEWSKTDPELEATVKEPLNQVDELSHSLESKAELDKITDCDAKQVDGEAEVDLDVDYEAKQVDKKVDVDLNVDNEGKQVDRLKSPPHKGGFQCPECDRKFSSASAIRCHRLWHKRPMGWAATQKKWNRKSIPSQCLFTCNECGKESTTLSMHRNHMRQHQDPKPYKSLLYQLAGLQKKNFKCEQNQRCTEMMKNESSEQLSSVNGHTRGISKRPTCPICGKKFRHRGILACHMRRHRSMPRKNHTCNICGKSYRLLGCFLKHQQVHESESVPPPVKSFQHQVEQVAYYTYSCPDCGKKFNRAMALQFHMRSHGYETGYPFSKSGVKAEAFQCSHCPVHFSSEEELQDHLNKKHGGCQSEISEGRLDGELQKSPGKLSHFLEKGQTSEVERKDKTVDGGPYRCDQCGKGFFYFCVLRRHQMHHPGSEAQAKTASSPPDPLQVSDGKPAAGGLSCPKCGKTFTRSSLLATHYQAHHVNTSDCAMCNLCFSSEGDLLKHCAEVHPGEKCLQPAEEMSTKPAPTKKPKLKHKLHGCPDCNKRFYKIRGLRAHRWQAHRKNQKATGSVTTTIKPFICTGCDKRYSSQGALYNHRKVCTASKIKSQPAKMDVEEEPSLPQRPSEQTYKWLFKCHKCGKAFPSHERLEAHKDIAKSRPHCCALCCRGYWTETQLQQHLVWHDEVRRRLPADLRYRLSTFTSPTKADLNPGDYTNEYHHDPSRPSVKPGPTSASGAQSPADHKCPQCGDSFPSFLTLQQHQTEHVSDVPYCCSLCPRTFSQVRDLIDHHQECMSESKDWIESGRAPLLGGPPRDGDGLTCIECGITFGQELELHQHYIEHARGQYEVI